MPWKVTPVLELRKVFVQQVLVLRRAVAAVCREHGISRKTAYKWLARHRGDPQIPLADRSRRPKRAPRRTSTEIETHVVEVRNRFGWGSRKIRAVLLAQGVAVPSVPTVNAILQRHGLITSTQRMEQPPPQFFTHSQPNELWQCDHKGPREVARQKIYSLTVIDDHSRFLLALHPCLDVTMKTAFAALWSVFGEFGLPERILCDNAFGSLHQVPKTPSWFEAQLIRLGIRPIHGRPYHPQTQGKVERLHGTLEREVWPHVRHDSLEHFAHDVDRWRTEIYNPLRPHEALNDQPPLARFRPSPRPRPDRLPEIEYPAGSVLRKVDSTGRIGWKTYRILAGAGLTGEYVRVEERDHDIAVFYAWKQIRLLAKTQLHRDNVL
jgi:transposase InsO family protein